MGNIESILAELAAKNFIVAGKKRKIKTETSRKIKRKDNTQNSKFSISTILIDSALKEIKETKGKSKENIPEEVLKEDAEGKIIEDERKIIVNGGYGTINKDYGTSPVAKYVNYETIWSNIGTFRSKSMYEDPLQNFASQSESKSTGILVDNKVIEKAERHFKYFVSGEVIGDVGLVPPVGTNIDSKDWEKYRIMTQMSIYRPLLALFRAIV